MAKYSQIDVLFNNAGAMVLGEPLLEINPVRWKQVVDVNVTGTCMVSRAVLPQMIRQMRGIIINVGSRIADALNLAAEPCTAPPKPPCTCSATAWRKRCGSTT